MQLLKIFPPDSPRRLSKTLFIRLSVRNLRTSLERISLFREELSSTTLYCVRSRKNWEETLSVRLFPVLWERSAAHFMLRSKPESVPQLFPKKSLPDLLILHVLLNAEVVRHIVSSTLSVSARDGNLFPETVVKRAAEWLQRIKFPIFTSINTTA